MGYLQKHLVAKIEPEPIQNQKQELKLELKPKKVNNSLSAEKLNSGNCWFTIEVPIVLKDKLKDIAKKERRNLRFMMEIALESFIKKYE